LLLGVLHLFSRYDRKLHYTGLPTSHWITGIVKKVTLTMLQQCKDNPTNASYANYRSKHLLYLMSKLWKY